MQQVRDASIKISFFPVEISDQKKRKDDTENLLAVILSLSGAGGLLGGALWLLFWWYAGFPVLSVLLGGMVSGFIFTSVLFNLTPLGECFTCFVWFSFATFRLRSFCQTVLLAGTSTIFVTPFNFGMAFTCGVLVVPVFLLAFTRTVSHSQQRFPFVRGEI